MFSPFPGMDPYLEGRLWLDVQDALANMIRRQLTPQLGSRYVARLDISVDQDVHPIFEMGIMYPDVKIVTTRAAHARLPERSPAAAGVAAAPIKVPVLDPMPVRLVNVEIRDVLQNKLITAIEILSPVNKREPGLTKYLQKRQQLRQANVHLLELDLLRRGARPLAILTCLRRLISFLCCAPGSGMQTSGPYNSLIPCPPCLYRCASLIQTWPWI